MFSRGSVIPLFLKQIKAGKSITVTDLNMTRFLMSLSESVDLVNYAFENSVSGDLLVKKAPAATVEVLVEALKQLCDAPDTKTQLIGVRHGEKIYESLLSTEEMAHAIDQDSYFRVPLDSRGLDYSIYFEEGESRTTELSSYTSHNTQRLDVDGVKKLLLTLPEVRQELNLA
jgi:UDP-glucose 4-epimerase